MFVIKDDIPKTCNTCIKTGLRTAIYCIEWATISSAERETHRATFCKLAELKRGKWIKQNPMVDTEECSECGYNILSPELETPYCPWCGAKMEKDK